jgi:hypothetical protein
VLEILLATEELKQDVLRPAINNLVIAEMLWMPPTLKE